VSSPQSTKITALANNEFDDKLSAKTRQIAPLENSVGPVDRIYYSDQDCLIVDEQWQRTLKVSSTHCHQWVLWNPGAEIAQSMKDLHQGAEHEFVCLEAANTDMHLVKPTETVMIGQEISIE
jgi:glucose-6-phosphate 1-epimerase